MLTRYNGNYWECKIRREQISRRDCECASVRRVPYTGGLFRQKNDDPGGRPPVSVTNIIMLHTELGENQCFVNVYDVAPAPVRVLQYVRAHATWLELQTKKSLCVKRTCNARAVTATRYVVIMLYERFPNSFLYLENRRRRVRADILTSL